jgi:excisionase family DNA binding protein
MDNTLDLLTVCEASALLRLKVSTVRAWLLKRKLPFVKLGGRVFLRRADCEGAINAGYIPAAHAITPTDKRKQGI